MGFFGVCLCAFCVCASCVLPVCVCACVLHPPPLRHRGSTASSARSACSRVKPDWECSIFFSLFGVSALSITQTHTTTDPHPHPPSTITQCVSSTAPTLSLSCHLSPLVSVGSTHSPKTQWKNPRTTVHLGIAPPSQNWQWGGRAHTHAAPNGRAVRVRARAPSHLPRLRARPSLSFFIPLAPPPLIGSRLSLSAPALRPRMMHPTTHTHHTHTTSPLACLRHATVTCVDTCSSSPAPPQLPAT